MYVAAISNTSAGVVKTSIVSPSESKNSTSKKLPSYSKTMVPSVVIPDEPFLKLYK